LSMCITDTASPLLAVGTAEAVPLAVEEALALGVDDVEGVDVGEADEDDEDVTSVVALRGDITLNSGISRSILYWVTVTIGNDDLTLSNTCTTPFFTI
jgi:hypothetical protein